VSGSSAAAAPDARVQHAKEVPSTTNLPAELAPLYGRDTEIDEVLQLVQQHRLVSIVGPSGIGKTRLAQAVAHRLGGTFDDGA
jgi:MoxR-like ATPase